MAEARLSLKCVYVFLAPTVYIYIYIYTHIYICIYIYIVIHIVISIQVIIRVCHRLYLYLTAENMSSFSHLYRELSPGVGTGCYPSIMLKRISFRTSGDTEALR